MCVCVCVCACACACVCVLARLGKDNTDNRCVHTMYVRMYVRPLTDCIGVAKVGSHHEWRASLCVYSIHLHTLLQQKL